MASWGGAPAAHRWLGEDGCSFSGVIHANSPEKSANGTVLKGRYNDSHASWEDAQKLLTGSCSLGTYGGPAAER